MCIYFRKRSRNNEVYFFCTKNKKKINFNTCKNCAEKEYKQYKPIKKKSNKLKKLEANRYSILTDNLLICYICQKKKKDDLHEVFGGSNRQTSIKWGLVIPVCRLCHKEWEEDIELKIRIQKEAKEKFCELYSKEKFLKEFGKNYIKEE